MSATKGFFSIEAAVFGDIDALNTTLLHIGLGTLLRLIDYHVRASN